MWREKKVNVEVVNGLITGQKGYDINEVILKDLQKIFPSLEQKLSSEIKKRIQAEIKENQIKKDSGKHLQKINDIVANCLNEMKLKQKQTLPCDIAWFYWKYSHKDRLYFHYQKPSDQAYRFSHLAQIAIGVTNRIVSRGGLSDIKNNEIEYKAWKRRYHDFNAFRATIQLICSEFNLFFIKFCHEQALIEQALLCVYSAISAKLAEESQWGSCGEKVWVLTHFFKKLGLDIRVEHFIIMRNVDFAQNNGNHTFIVLGRDEKSDPNDYTTWGNDAIICDPWAEKQYFVRDIPQILCDCDQVQYRYALLPVVDFKPEPATIYFQKQNDDIRCFFTNSNGIFTNCVYKNIHHSKTLVIEDIIPFCDEVLEDLINRNLIFVVKIKNSEVPYHPFANSLKLSADDGIKILTTGFEYLYFDINFGLKDGLQTHNFELIEKSFNRLIENDHNLDWTLFDSLEPDFKRTCLEKLLDLALKERNETIILELSRRGYGSPEQQAHIGQLKFNSYVFETNRKEIEELDLDEEDLESEPESEEQQKKSMTNLP